jgi:hypothetical protein
LRIALFCEAAGDFRTAAGLVDRVLREEGPDWVRDLVEAHPEAVRTWVEDGEGRSFFDIHRLSNYAQGIRGLRIPQGHFDGKPREPGALMARTIFHLVRALAKQAARAGAEGVDAVILVWDMDQQGEARRAGLAQAREEADASGRFRVVLGCPDPEREAWVLAGFEPEDDAERERLAEERRALGFCPCEEAHRLRDGEDRAPRSPKRVLRDLTGGGEAREARCWEDATLDRLRARGGGSGLSAFLDEVREHVAGGCEARPSPPR